MALPQVTLEGLIPGYGLLLHFATSVFGVHIPSYIYIPPIFVAFCVYGLPKLWARFLQLLLDLAVSIEIPYHDGLYDPVIDWISNNPGLSKTRRSTAVTRLNAAPASMNKEKNLSGKDKLTLQSNPQKFWLDQKIQSTLAPIYYLPALSQVNPFTHRGYRFAVSCHLYEEAFRNWSIKREKVIFYAAPWDSQALKNFLAEILKNWVEKDNMSVIVKRASNIGRDMVWRPFVSRTPRPLSTIFLERKNKKQIMRDIQDYLLPITQNWYRSRSLPYRRGYLFHGPPGTGKSSMAIAMASWCKLDIYIISLVANGLDEDSLFSLFHDLPPKCIILLEDVDRAGIKQRNNSEAIIDEPNHHERPLGGITLAALLNVIDGVAAQEGRILILTTNHIDELDDALLRPGRVDMQVYFGCADRLACQEMFLYFYLGPTNELFMGQQGPDGYICPSPTLTSADWDSDYIRKLSITFAEKISPTTCTPAQVQNYLLQYRNSPELAANDATEWSNKHLHLDWDKDLSPIHDGHDQFKIKGTAYCIRVAAYIFSYSQGEPRVLLVKRAPGDSKPGFSEGPAGCVGGEDKTLRDALAREVHEETGLHLSQITHTLPMQKWTTLRCNIIRKWIGFSYIITVSQSEAGWEEKIKVNPEEHDSYTWAAEEQVTDEEYSFYGEQKTQILKAFSVLRENRLSLSWDQDV